MDALALAIVAVIVINVLVSFFQEYRAEQASEALRRLLPDRVTVLRSGERLEVQVRDIVPGDVLLLAEGNRVPADLVLSRQHS